MITRSFYSIASADLARSRDWYVELFGYEVGFDSDWFVHLQAAGQPALELGILARDHAVVPEAARSGSAGGLLTIVVDDVDAIHRLAERRGVRIVEAPTDLFYGQRRMLLADPDGYVVDVSSECEPDPVWLASLGG